MKRVLSVFWPDQRDAVEASLVWEDGCVTMPTCVDDLRSTLDGFIDNGLNEFVGRGASSLHRHTKSSDPAFLPRLSEYLRLQSGFATELKSEPENFRVVW